jgi:hypothetical protein
MHKISIKRKIKTSYEALLNILWKIEAWSYFWSPIHQVYISYDDGIHQDFCMYLDWQNESSFIRTVRFLDHKRNINFFSPSPPPPMAIHHGQWELNIDAEQNVELTATRWFKLHEINEESSEIYEKRLSLFSNGFEKRLERLLENLGNLCEKST